jgi:Flp pilus assembly protein TadG
MVRARGQALVEFLVTAVALVPVLVGIVVVGRLHDLQRAVDQSARYAAFALALGERDTPALQAEVRARFFASPDAPVLAADADPRARPRTDANPNWSDYSLAPTPLVPTPDAVTLRAAWRSRPPRSSARPRGPPAASTSRPAATPGRP